MSKCNHNDDEDEEDEDNNSISYDINYHTMHVDTRFRILSIEEIKNE